MEINWKLVERILKDIVKERVGRVGSHKIDGITEEEIRYHVKLMLDEGLLMKCSHKWGYSIGGMSIEGVSLLGHKLLNHLRNDELMAAQNQSMEKVPSVGYVLEYMKVRSAK